MVGVRACVTFSVIFLCFNVAFAKPFFGLTGLFWCDIFCEDDDPTSTTTSASNEDIYDDLFCSGCEPRRRRTTTPNPLNVNTVGIGRPPQSLNIQIPQGVNINMSPPGAGGGWLSISPWTGPTGAPPAGTPAPGTPAPAATTAAGATAAPAATTVAPTTAAAARK
ncbi:uncharacterized protein LOC142976702 [Anticarsia gemmatalis]|uniref:uncharacterized protein LOC142976702 n=1 Tax=Anticarsia gemmatalis TaxID=129554 RepID=UPI003F75AF25